MSNWMKWIGFAAVVSVFITVGDAAAGAIRNIGKKPEPMPETTPATPAEPAAPVTQVQKSAIEIASEELALAKLDYLKSRNALEDTKKVYAGFGREPNDAEKKVLDKLEKCTKKKEDIWIEKAKGMITSFLEVTPITIVE